MTKKSYHLFDPIDSSIGSLHGDTKKLEFWPSKSTYSKDELLDITRIIDYIAQFIKENDWDIGDTYYL